MTSDYNCIPTITNDGIGASSFSSRDIELKGEPIRQLSEQQNCVNFRLRRSTPDFLSDFHVAGDPTLLVILNGTVRIELRDGGILDFSAGDMFVAEDYLRAGVKFDSSVHGHRSEVIGGDVLEVLHLKLERRAD